MINYEDYHNEIFANNPSTDEKSVKRLFVLVARHLESVGFNFDMPVQKIKKLTVFNEYSLFFNLSFCQNITKVQKYNKNTQTYTDIIDYSVHNHYYLTDFICLIKLTTPLLSYEELHVEATFGIGTKAPIEIQSIVINYLLSKTSATKNDYGNLNIKSSSEADSKIEFFESKTTTTLDLNRDSYFQNLFNDYI
jgi:hypothetical protein